MGKFHLFRAAIERGTEIGDASLFWLAIIGVLNSAISLAYYLRVPLVMYFRDAAPTSDPDAPGFFERVVLLACLAAVVLLGIVPDDVFNVLSQTAASAQHLLLLQSP
jgi:NADH-quinone oxidoreductase subunit N